MPAKVSSRVAGCLPGRHPATLACLAAPAAATRRRTCRRRRTGSGASRCSATAGVGRLLRTTCRRSPGRWRLRRGMKTAKRVSGRIESPPYVWNDWKNHVRLRGLVGASGAVPGVRGIRGGPRASTRSDVFRDSANEVLISSVCGVGGIGMRRFCIGGRISQLLLQEDPASGAAGGAAPVAVRHLTPAQPIPPDWRSQEEAPLAGAVSSFRGRRPERSRR
jgi:hypothetical protein